MAPDAAHSERTQQWLEQRLILLIAAYFRDIPAGHPIVIKYGTRALRALGSIRLKDTTSVIHINRLFQHPEIPEYVVDATICHEMAHFMHGFGSRMPRLYDNPHKDGVVTRELMKRGCGDLERLADAWVKQNWERQYGKLAPDLVDSRSQAKTAGDQIWESWLNLPKRRSEAQLQLVAKETAAYLGLPCLSLPLTWKHTTLRQVSTSYRIKTTGQIQLNGVLAHMDVPDHVIRFEIAYWILFENGYRTWSTIHSALCRSPQWHKFEWAIKWREKNWRKFLAKHHPLG